MTQVDAELTDVDVEDDNSADGRTLTAVRKFEDSDDEDDYYDADSDLSDIESEGAQPQPKAATPTSFPSITPRSDTEAERKDVSMAEDNSDPSMSPLEEVAVGVEAGLSKMFAVEDLPETEGDRNVIRKLSHPSSPRSRQSPLPQAPPEQILDNAAATSKPQDKTEKPVPGPSKVRARLDLSLRNQ